MDAAANPWQRSGPTAQQQRWDLLVGSLLVVGALISLFLSRSMGTDLGVPRPSAREESLWVLAVAAPLCLRRRFPLSVLLVCAAAFIGLQARFVAESTLTSICLFAALYTAGAWGRDRRITLAVRGLVVLSMFCWLIYSISATAWAEVARPSDPPVTGPLPPQLASMLYVTLLNLLFFAGAWYFGGAAWSRARQDHELAQRTAELRIERDENARRAVFADRVRIARELHDVVAHHVSVMGVQAGAARRVLSTDPGLARHTLAHIEAAGRAAVGELQRLLIVLREHNDPGNGPSDPGGGPAPDCHCLPMLFGVGNTPGLATGYTVIGEPIPLPAALSVSLYRIAQEALTNTIRHAGASRCDARLRYLDEAVELEIVDDGRGRTGGTSHGSGLGLVGMRERVNLHGGHLDAGPRHGGGYRVRARFPLPQPADQAPTQADQAADQAPAQATTQATAT
jgi:signal transduction histidine kinase